MEILFRLLIILFLLFFGVDEAAVPPAPEPQTVVHTLTHIDGVQAAILNSHPAQISLVITGTQPDGCDFPVQVAQHRDGSTVTLEIYREAPLGVMCPMIVLPYTATVPLDGEFESGTYTILVNDFTLEVTV